MSRHAHLRRLGVPTAWLLAGAMAVVSLTLLLVHVRHLASPHPPVRIQWWLIALVFALAERYVIHIKIHREVESFSLSEIPLVIGLFFLDPVTLVAARTLGGGVAIWRRRGQSWLKRAFNVAHFALESVIAVTVFAHVVGPELRGPTGWAGAFAATFSADVVGAAMILSMIALVTGRPELRKVPESLALGVIAACTNTGMGLIAVTVLWFEPAAVWLLMMAAAILFFAYRGYASIRARQEDLEQLYESTLVGQRTTDASDVIRGLLEHTRSMFNASWTEVVLLGDESPATRTTLGLSGQVLAEPVWPAEEDLVFERVIGANASVIASVSGRDRRAGRWLEKRQSREMIAAPLRSDEHVVGALIVGDPVNRVTRFTRHDLSVLSTLANHAAVALDNVSLIERLRTQAAENQYMALHDALTGLANRTLLRTRARQAIAVARGPGRVCLMIADLDRFKDVNDTLGHQVGDVLLREVARRLTAAVGGRGTVARFGSDEFAILIPDAGGEAMPADVAAQALAALREPFETGGFSLDLDASIGIAMYPDHGEEPEVLLQRADVAMYLAKEARTGFEFYDQERDRYSPERLAMVAELRRAIERGGLSLVFQPKAALADGRVTGVEALVRWEHADRGPVRPDEFIPIAEHTGLIRPLTRWVVQAALEETRRFWREGLPLTVSVNLSARELRDADLADEIRAGLREVGLPPDALILEITESSIMADPARAIETLDRLAAMGVGLSIDDFGTGYSSLAYLKRLPARELKIDRSFVMGMLDDPDDEVIVRSTIDLGRNLGKRVVAEGVETRALLERLDEMGCDLVQGYFLGRPMDADTLLRWLRATGSAIETPSSMLRQRAIV